MNNYVCMARHRPLRHSVDLCSKVFAGVNSLKALRMTPSLQPVKEDLLSVFHAAVSSVLPNNLIRNSLQFAGQTLNIGMGEYVLNKNCFMIGFGKAVLGMATEAEKILHEHLVTGVISVPVGIRDALKRSPNMIPKKDSVLEILEGAKNNMPDEMAVLAAKKIAELVKGLDEKALLVVLISGGGSALLPYPIPPVTLQEKISVCNLLVSKGATIQELNCIRKRLSVLKGGGLAKLAYPAQVISLILSDVVDDPIDYIASGPTVVNTDLPQKAWNIVRHYGLEAQMPASVIEILKSPYSKEHEVPSDLKTFNHAQTVIVGNNCHAINAAKEEALKRGYEVLVLSTRIQTTVSVMNQLYVSLCVLICKFLSGQISQLDGYLCEIIETYGHILEPQVGNTILSAVSNYDKVKGICLLGAGETTVHISGTGTGGRNQELALSFAIHIHDATMGNPFLKNYSIVMLSAGTDGIDGPTDAAGAFGYRQQCEAASTQDLSPQKYLANNDSYGFYSKLHSGEDLLKTGHTGTNVMDVQIVAIQSAPTI